jgi:NAD(P)-dependent dehydrogenase (short-subunit alcohol dehydrogenase family)
MAGRSGAASGRFAGQVAVVSGGAGGIGAAIAERLAVAGAQVVLADLDVDGAARRAAAIGDRAESVTLDVTDADACAALVADVEERHGGIDVLVCSAGLAVGGPAEDLPPELWRRPVEVNLLGTINLVAPVYPRMARRGSGDIVTIASLAGLAPAPLLAGYSASKWGVVGLSESLRREGGRHGIRVTTVCPGATDTPLLRTGGRGGAVSPRVDPVAYLEALGGPTLPVDKVADAALRGMRRGGVVTPGAAAVVWRLQRFAPRLVGAMADRQIRRHLAP